MSTSPVPAVASDGGPRSQTTHAPSGAATIVSAPLSRHDRAESLGAAPRGLEPVRVHPAAVVAEQPRELARVRRQHGRRGPVDGLELEERVGVDDRREVEALEELADERPPSAPRPRPGPDRERRRALCAAAIVSTASASSSRPSPARAASTSTTGSDASGTASVT